MDKSVLNKVSYGVYIVTTWIDGKPTGCVANSMMQVTSEPATFAVSINHANYTHECIKKLGRFAINILPETIAPEIIGTFGFKSGRDFDKFASTKYSVKDMLPIIDGSCGYIACEIVDSMDTDTHTVFLGKLVNAETLNNDPPMTYEYYHRVVKGGAPKTAPTYNEAQTSTATSSGKKKYRCTICGYVYEGDELPDDYVCPICGVGPELFVEEK